MAKGIRRAKSPLRAALAPLYPLQLQWRPGRTGMGTLIDVQRGNVLLNETAHLQGLELLALAASLFQEGDQHAYPIVFEGLQRLQQRPDDVGMCATQWHMLKQAGWLGDLTHCWQCSEVVNDTESMHWQHGQLACTPCGRGIKISAGLRKSIRACMQQHTSANIHMSSSDTKQWKHMIQDTLRTHRS